MYRIYRKLDQLDVEALGALSGKYSDVPELHFSTDAQELFDQWHGRLERRLRSQDLGTPAFESHLAKYRSLMPTLALLFHLVDFAAKGQAGSGVAVAATQKAAAWCDFLESHAKKVYAGALLPDIHAAHALHRRFRAAHVLHLRNAEFLRSRPQTS